MFWVPTKRDVKANAWHLRMVRSLGARLTAFHASPDYPLPVYADGVVYEPLSRREYAEACAKEADKILSAVAAKAKLARVRFDQAHSISATPWEAILAAARRNKCDAIVMASHGRRGISAIVLGSQTVKVLTHCKIPVLVYR